MRKPPEPPIGIDTSHASVWFYERRGLHWFGFLEAAQAQYVARRLKVVGIRAVVLPFWWEPEEWQRSPLAQDVAERGSHANQ